MRILFLSRWYPHPPDNGSKLRVLALLKGLAEQHRVTLISFYDPDAGAPDMEALRPYCADVQVIPRSDFNPQSWRSQLGFFSPTPRSVLDTYSMEVESAVRSVLSSDGYDLVIASQFDMALYADCWQLLPSIFEEVEIGVYLDQFEKAEHLTSRLRAGLTWWKHRRYLADLLKKFSVCTVVSPQERQILEGVAPELTNLYVVPNGVQLQDYSTIHAEPEPNTLIYTGSFRYEPNYEAMLWFTEKVFPILLESAPDVRLIITGDHAGRALPTSTNITLTGYLPDIKEAVARAWISLAPIHSGGGTRLKILEAMALGTPVIATSKGAEGLEVIPGKHLLIADQPADFAAACLQLLQSPELRNRLAEQANQALRECYSWQAIMPRFLQLVAETASRSRT